MAWYRMPLTERVKINNRIKSKSLDKAIAEKDINYVYQVAGMAQRTYDNNYEEGQKAYQQMLLDYYKGINDTSNYLKNVVQFYDKFYMTVSPEKIKQEDSIQLKKTLSSTPTDSVITKSDSTAFRYRIYRKPVTFQPKAQFYAIALNNGAWTIYTYTNNITYITKALVWAKQALNFYETPEIMDTYGRLLYKTNNKEEAIIWEKKAIEKRKEQKYSTSEYEKTLEMMQNNSKKLLGEF
jgi:hypothetical protein